MKMRLWFLLGLCAAAIAWFYMQQVLGPWEYHDNVERGRVKAQMGDLYPRWAGMQALLCEHKNPYSPEVSHRIQMAYYGHPVLAQNYDDKEKILDEQRFAYPVYVVLLLAPFAHVSFAAAQFWSPFLLGIFIAAAVLLYLRALHWSPPWPVAAAIIIFTLASPQIIQGIHLRQLGLLVGFLIAFAFWCVCKNRLALAGIALALATIKPQMVLLPLVWFLFWSIARLRQRWRLPAAFAASMIVLVAAGEWLLPGWMGFFFEGMTAYPKYVPIVSPLRLFLGTAFGTIASAILVFAALFLAWKNRNCTSDSTEFSQTMAAFCICTTLALPLLPPFNQVVLLLPLLLLLRDWHSLPKTLRNIFVVVLAWPWAASLVLLIFRPNVHSLSRLPLLPSALVILVPFFIPILLWSARRTDALADHQ